MACSQPIRGKTDAAFPPVQGQPDPCGKLELDTINAVAVTDTLCLPHWQLKNGAILTPNPTYTFVP